MRKIKIRERAVSHGKNIVNNEFYLKHFEKQGKDVKHFFEDVMGRNLRYEIDKDTETALTLAKKAVKDSVENSGISGKDIDMIIYAGTLPEYSTPISALFVHDAIEGKKECFCHDMNVNCLGMTYAFDMASKYIDSDSNINRVLIVGSDILTVGVSPENEGNYGQFGDVACAVIVEETEEESRLIDTKVGVDTTYIDKSKFPKCGFSHAFEDLPKEEMYAEWQPAPPWWIDGISDNIKAMLSDKNISIDDVSMFCFTQIAYNNILKFRKRLSIPEEKSIFIADSYGYTGTSSPFVALYEAIKRGKVKRGDYVFLATAAAGGIHITELIKY